MTMTRREWLTRVGMAGGLGAVQMALQGLGITTAEAATNLPRLAPGSGDGRSVVILGAGLAGMAAAYELRRAGYHCTVLEARARTGGKNWTLRGGDTVRFTDGRTQQVTFSQGQYFNAGAGRIPSHHTALLGYCRQFGVALEVEVNSNHSAAIQDDAVDGGKPIALRRVWNDTRGHVSELLAKAIKQHALDQSLDARDQERMIAFLRQYGDLSPDLLYKGSSRSGYTALPGAANDAGTINPPVPMDALLDADMWHAIMFDELFVMQSTMFQPVGGMDMIAKAFQHQLGDMVKLGSVVQHIGRKGDGVSIAYKDRTGAVQNIAADFCVCTIPHAVLSSIPSDFSADVKRAIAAPSAHPRQKTAFEAPRFWERDYGVYGGITYMKWPNNAVIWHPSGEMMSDRGVLVLYGGETEISPQPLDRQYDIARGAIGKIYPGHERELGKPVSVTWSSIPYSLGTGAVFTPETQWAYDRLNRADGPFFFANDYLTNINGWQEGAIRSAYHAIDGIVAAQATGHAGARAG